MQYQQQRTIQHCPYVPRRSVTASDDIWQIEMKYAFSGPTATRCCSCYFHCVKRVFAWRSVYCMKLLYGVAVDVGIMSGSSHVCWRLHKVRRRSGWSRYVIRSFNKRLFRLNVNSSHWVGIKVSIQVIYLDLRRKVTVCRIMHVLCQWHRR